MKFNSLTDVDIIVLRFWNRLNKTTYPRAKPNALLQFKRHIKDFYACLYSTEQDMKISIQQCMETINE